ncbi:hypothetical protein ACIHFE_20950 [Streptomyces sp. NPDC052396]|uniref:hypothetical protein n=1 Tax=Streptomyces sp. NPDC052396 TaxID=3365689 RepID=UPI0037D1994C
MSHPDARAPERAAPASGAADYAKVLIGQASLIAALMFYVGAVYTSSYYGYFHLSPFTLGLGFPELVVESLNLLKLPVLVAGVAVLLLAGLPPSSRRIRAAVTARAARLHLPVVAAGLVLLVLWRWIQPYGWIVPLVIAAGLLLGQAGGGRERLEGVRRRVLSLLATGLLLLWAVTVLAAQLGESDARGRARDVTGWTGVLVLSGRRLSLPGVREEDLGAGLRHRYRYTGLRQLVEGQDGYYVVPLGWNVGTDAVYVIPKGGDTWVGLTPGTRQ